MSTLRLPRILLPAFLPFVLTSAAGAQGVCVTEASGPRIVQARVERANGDTVVAVDGRARRLREAYPARGRLPWAYAADGSPAPVRAQGYLWEAEGPVRTLLPEEAHRSGEIGGTPAFAATWDRPAQPELLYVPVGGRCAFQGFRRGRYVGIPRRVPDAALLDSVAISHGGCADCPAFDFVLARDGTARYAGRAEVRPLGEHALRAPPELWAAVAGRAAALAGDSLEESYGRPPGAAGFPLRLYFRGEDPIQTEGSLPAPVDSLRALVFRASREVAGWGRVVDVATLDEGWTRRTSRRTYTVSGRRLGGRITLDLQETEDGWLSTLAAHPALEGVLRSAIRFGGNPTRDPLQVRATVLTPDGPATYEASRNRDTLAWLLTGPGERERRTAFRDVGGAVLQVAVHALESARLNPGDWVAVPVLPLGGGEPGRRIWHVAGEEEVRTRAGRFRAYRVEAVDAPVPLTLYLAAEAPHTLLRAVYGRAPDLVRVELRTLREQPRAGAPARPDR
ncbi:MAG TPA: hypothetical protein VF746_20605 [Longimicrobium sp.]|jgi:hypothetical protein